MAPWKDCVDFLPEKFLQSYDSLCDKIFGEGKGISSPMGKRGIATFSKLKNPDGGIKDGQAINYRKTVDRRLRALAREMDHWLETKEDRKEIEGRQQQKCRNCGKFVDAAWAFCGWCGKKAKPHEVQSKAS